MQKDYAKSIDEMLQFIEEYDVYLYSVLYRYAATYNYDWYCALKSKIGRSGMLPATRMRLANKKKAGTLSKCDPMKQFEEYDNLVERLPEELLKESGVNVSFEDDLQD